MWPSFIYFTVSWRMASVKTPRLPEKDGQAGHTVPWCYANEASVGRSPLSDLLSELQPPERQGEGPPRQDVNEALL